MSTTHKLGRSLPIAGAAALLVVGASFAHDSGAPTSTTHSTTGEIRVGDDDLQIDALVGTGAEVEDAQGDEDDLAGKAEDDLETGDQAENDQAENDHQAAPEAPKPAKTHKAKPATHIVASHDASEAEDNNDDQGEDNNDQGEDGDHQGSHDGEHDDGGDNGGDNGGDD
jgi:hypothetical protein